MNMVQHRAKVHTGNSGFEPTSNKMFGMPGGIMEAYSYPAPVTDHVIYIDDLEDLQDHMSRLQTIRMAQPEDSIRVIINSPGGCVHIAMAYLQAFRETQAHIVTHAEGMICSAGTILWLGCAERTIAPFTETMFHYYQGASYGNGANMSTQTEYWRSRFNKIIDKMYSGVLTPEEISKIKGGGEVWMDGEELAERTGAILLDEENIKRIQSGGQPVKGMPKEHGVLGEAGLPEVLQCKSLDELVAAVEKAKTNMGSGDKHSVLLNIQMEDGKSFKFGLGDITPEDLKDFTIKELQEILSQVKATLQGKDFVEVKDKKRERLVGNIIKFSKELNDKILSAGNSN
ncbi:ATP-dependent Clp protease proteolytic subunit [Escherichia coli]|uniref:ATP-dependent Clp protease proteolytic subunit n=1 Tax=Escherichia coli TaxID=562 RepID=UPI000CFC0BBE|nr:ATP-dependent Clp protease proteolytic subunit [Escherichia coli]